MNIPKYIEEMGCHEFLEHLDDFGDGHHWAHEAAKRIRSLNDAYRSQLRKRTQDTKRLDWLAENITKLGIPADWKGVWLDGQPAFEYTDIRSKIDALMELGNRESEE